MSVYVDQLRSYPTGTVKGAARATAWCHMSADTEGELHAMALQIGMKREWFQQHKTNAAFDHYDLTRSRRAAAIAAGAVEEDTKAFIRRVRLAVPS